MKNTIRAGILFTPDILLVLLSIALALGLFYSSSGALVHLDWKGTVNGYSDKHTVFVIPALAMGIYILFNVLKRYPSFLMKGNSFDEKSKRSTLFYWTILKFLCLVSLNGVLIVSYFPKISFIMLLITGLFTIYTVIYLVRAYKQIK